MNAYEIKHIDAARRLHQCRAIAANVTEAEERVIAIYGEAIGMNTRRISAMPAAANPTNPKPAQAGAPSLCMPTRTLLDPTFTYRKGTNVTETWERARQAMQGQKQQALDL